MTLLCRRFGVSRRTGYKWLNRYRKAGADGLKDQSRRPRTNPGRVGQSLEKKVVAIRKTHRSWGGRKIKQVLEDRGEQGVCSPSAITAILRRNGLIDPAQSQQRADPIRFCYPAPNDLWQMDFKGHFPLADGNRCHPLTVLDDHSRYSLVIGCCSSEKSETVKSLLQAAFEKYGLPKRLLCDNGPPRASSGTGGWDSYTPLGLWMIRLGIQLIHGRARHRQIQGKIERFHRTMVEEVPRWEFFQDPNHSHRVHAAVA